MSGRIDFNCDLGEGCGDDAAILPYVTSANIACGGHAGDEASMRETLRLCRAHGVATGAHPGYEDREHFGRRALALAHDEVVALVTRQLARLAAIADEEGVALTHLKPHGALYNLAADDRGVAEAIAGAVAQCDPRLIVFGLAQSELTDAAQRLGLRVAHEVFAERGYAANGRLLPRGQPGAVIESLDQAIAQVRELALHGRVRAAGDETVALRADTLCLHGDRSDAAQFARAVRAALEADGVRVAAL
ncbi:5-oxoprolinase subunit PxpA [Lysobacter yananisis]|uniref:5-oxoprolinase subunit PxpA n=1 Tax=Lysobacter yananisis TaxID=1003114 RepID=A0ABY9P6I9_9GAMM|nr:5-oxoprolinase subunit PxpA [Lysobacter yananisis]WMT01630.1 5-oxoprolinase subunit PxpA [Lysobacter yananisis]